MQRDVALKFLLPRSDGDGRSDLLREARALARVHHPNVVMVHGIDERDGKTAMWMEYLRGNTLAREIEERGPMPARMARSIGIQLCSALEAIHGAGLIHRDIKPANIVLESERRAVVTDFGLGWRPALPGSSGQPSSGTPYFMAPELLAGGSPTARSDLYALGVTLWWALAGRSPFRSRTLQEHRAEAFAGAATSLGELRPDVPSDLVKTIERAMAPDPDRRFGSAAEMAVLLKGPEPRLATARRRGRFRSVLASMALLLTLVVVLNWQEVKRFLTSSPSRDVPTVAVLPFVNQGGNASEEFFADGMTEELISRLAVVDGLRVISRHSVMTFKNTDKPLAHIAEKLRVSMVLEGSVARTPGTLRIAVRLVDVRTGQAVWARVYERGAREAFEIEGEIASEVVRLLRARITPDERQRLVGVSERNPEAHAAYLQGLAAYRLLTPEGTRRSVRLYERALEIDSTYADAWSGLALSYDQGVGQHVWDRRNGRERAASAARKALEWDPKSGIALAMIASLQMWNDFDLGSAERSYREALALSPGSADIRVELALVLVGMARFEEAAAQVARARELDPLSSLAAAVSLFPLFEGRRFPEAARSAREVLATHPSPNVRLVLGQSLLFSGKGEEAIAALSESDRETPAYPFTKGWLAVAYARTGRHEEARSELAALHELRKQKNVDPYLFAIVHAWLGEPERALDFLDSSMKERRGELVFLLVDPALDPLRKEPRFLEMVRKLGLHRWGPGDRIHTWRPGEGS